MEISRVGHECLPHLFNGGPDDIEDIAPPPAVDGTNGFPDRVVQEDGLTIRLLDQKACARPIADQGIVPIHLGVLGNPANPVDPVGVDLSGGNQDWYAKQSFDPAAVGSDVFFGVANAETQVQRGKRARTDTLFAVEHGMPGSQVAAPEYSGFVGFFRLTGYHLKYGIKKGKAPKGFPLLCQYLFTCSA